MTKAKLTRAEKQLIKALIAYLAEKGIELNANHIENKLKDITDMVNMEHRYLVEEYAQSEIDKK